MSPEDDIDLTMFTRDLMQQVEKDLPVTLRWGAVNHYDTANSRCVVEKKWLSRNPLELVKGTGKVRHGKEQLRIDEAGRWMVEARRLADAGNDGAVAAMMALVMGMRCSEIVRRVVRDLDDGGTLLWSPDSKTLAGRRQLQVPEFLQPYLVRLARGRAPEAWLFGGQCHFVAWQEVTRSYRTRLFQG